jgi:hypothetical protein
MLAAKTPPCVQPPFSKAAIYLPKRRAMPELASEITMKLLGKTILSLAVAATTFASIPAEAGDRWRHHHRHYRGHSDNGDAAIAGIAGLAIGALVVGAIANDRDDRYYDRNPYRNPRPHPDRDILLGEVPDDVVVGSSYDAAFEPWSRSWFRYCRQTYRSFDSRTGTYMGYDGREHFCTAD